MCPVCRCPHFLGLPWAGRITGNRKSLFLMFFPNQSLLFKNGFLLACLCPLVQGIDPKNKLGDLPQFSCKLSQIDRGVLDRPRDLPRDSRQWFCEFRHNTADVPSCTLSSKPSPSFHLPGSLGHYSLKSSGFCNPDLLSFCYCCCSCFKDHLLLGIFGNLFFFKVIFTMVTLYFSVWKSVLSYLWSYLWLQIQVASTTSVTVPALGWILEWSGQITQAWDFSTVGLYKRWTCLACSEATWSCFWNGTFTRPLNSRSVLVGTLRFSHHGVPEYPTTQQPMLLRGSVSRENTIISPVLAPGVALSHT